MKDDWSESDGAVIAECDRCHKKTRCVFRGDPYLAEIYPEDENPERWWCGECYQNRLWGI